MKNRIFVLLVATVLTPYTALAMDPPNESKHLHNRSQETP